MADELFTRERPSKLGEEMGTTRLLLRCETLMITQLQGIFIPDQSGPGLTTNALSIDDLQGGSVKYATDDNNLKHFVNHSANHNDELKLAKNNFTARTWNIGTIYCKG